MNNRNGQIVKSFGKKLCEMCVYNIYNIHNYTFKICKYLFQNVILTELVENVFNDEEE